VRGGAALGEGGPELGLERGSGRGDRVPMRSLSLVDRVLGCEVAM
jgi:hypothetical protein